MTILSQAETIRDETSAGQNTADRVGSCLVDIAGRIEAKGMAQFTMSGNSTATNCASTSAFFKIAGTTVDNASIRNGFTVSSANRVTCTDTVARKYSVRASASLLCDHGNHILEIGFYLSSGAAVDTTTVGRSNVSSGASRPTQICADGIYELENGDYVELHLRGVESAESYIVTNMVFTVSEV